MAQLFCIMSFGIMDLLLIGMAVDSWQQSAKILEKQLSSEWTSHYCGTLAATERNLAEAAEILATNGFVTQSIAEEAAAAAVDAISQEFEADCSSAQFELYRQSGGSSRWPNWHYLLGVHA